MTHKPTIEMPAAVIARHLIERAMEYGYVDVLDARVEVDSFTITDLAESVDAATRYHDGSMMLSGETGEVVWECSYTPGGRDEGDADLALWRA